MKIFRAIARAFMALFPAVTVAADDRCTCTAATICPLGRTGSGPRCTRAELVAAGVRITQSRELYGTFPSQPDGED